MDSIGKGMASISICALGALSMSITHSSTGIGWVIIGLIIIWGD